MELVFIVIIKNTKKLMRCSGSASFFLKKTCKQKKWAAENISKKNLKTYRRDDYVKSVKKNIHKQKTYTQKKNKRLLADDLKKEKIREIDNEKKKNTTIKKIYTQIQQNTQKIPY